MKTLKYFSLFIAAGLFAACSDNLTEGNGDNNDGPKTGEGYVKVAINMPTVSGSRADESFDHGSENEYAVKTGIIAFFEGVNESEATFVKAYNLKDLSGTQENNATLNNQISTVVTQIIEAPLKKESSNTMYALVILNNGTVASVNSNGELTLENGGSDITLTSSSSTIAALNGGASTSNDVEWALNVSDITSNTNGFLMLNAPLYKKNEQDSQHETQTLVPVNVYERKEQADGAIADKIYVERIVAKVDVKLDEEEAGTAGTLTVQDGIFKNDKVIFYQSSDQDNFGWVLNVTNKTTKPLRDVSEISTWIGYNDTNTGWVGTDNSLNGWNRIYWAKDNNYNTDDYTDDFTIYSSNETNQPSSWGGYTTTSNGAETVVPQYCLENTNVGTKYMENNTTAVLIKAKYIIDGNEDSDGDSFFIMDKVAKTMTETQFTNQIASILKGDGGDTYTVSIKKTLTTGGVFSGKNQLNNLLSIQKGGDSSYEINEADAAKIGEVRYYKDGACYYYTIPIQHLSSIPKLEEGVTDENYTGKYGVVRNNWYQITINSVSGPGEPEIPDPEGPVDKEEGYIKAEINVLSWAKRTQNVDL